MSFRRERAFIMKMLNKRTINRVAKPEREMRCIKALRGCQSTSRRRHGTPREGSRAVPGDGGEAGLWGAVPGDGREQEEHAGPWGQRKKGCGRRLLRTAPFLEEEEPAREKLARKMSTWWTGRGRHEKGR